MKFSTTIVLAILAATTLAAPTAVVPGPASSNVEPYVAPNTDAVLETRDATLAKRWVKEVSERCSNDPSATKSSADLRRARPLLVEIFQYLHWIRLCRRLRLQWHFPPAAAVLDFRLAVCRCWRWQH